MVTPAVYLAIRKVPFASVFLFFGTGIVTGYYLPLTQSIFRGLGYSAMLMVVLLLGMEIIGRSWRRVVFPLIFYSWLFLLGILWIARELPAQQANYIQPAQAEYLIGVIADEPVYGDLRIRFPVTIRKQVQGNKERVAAGQIMLHIARSDTTADLNLSYGDKLLFPNALREFSEPYNPKQFNYKRYLAHKNIYYQAYLQPSAIRVLDDNQGNIVVAYALAIRRYFVEKYVHYIADSDARDIVAALILGYRAHFPVETLTAFVNTGTVHVLSVSGLHVGLVFLLLNFILGFLDRFRYGKSLRFVLILSAIWAYVLLTGMAPSILRAGVMISFLLVAGWSRRANQNLNSLFASACCLLFLDPFMIFDMGFQLSYVAVLGLFTLYPMLNKLFEINNRWLRGVWQAVLVSLSAQLFTTPLALFYFHQFPNYFLLGNLFVSLPAMAVMYIGITLAVSPFPWLNGYLAMGLTFVCRLLLGGLQGIEALPFAVTQGIDFSGVQLGCSFLVISFFLLTWLSLRKSFLWGTLFSIGMLLLSVVITSMHYASYQGLKVYNVGREVAIAAIDRGKVSLFSTLDSLKHPQLVRQVLPDLNHYVRTAAIDFHPLQLKKDVQVNIRTSVGTLGIIEGKRIAHDAPAQDILLWRNMSFYDQIHSEQFAGTGMLLIDGSNHADRLAEMIKKADSLDIAYYVLKNNFAYVWEKK